MGNPLEDTAEYPLTEIVTKTFFTHRYKPVDLKIGSLTHQGYKRKQNQDHYAVMKRRRTQELIQSDLPLEDFQGVEDVAHLMIVADGIGGSAFGELASRLVIQKIWELAAISASWVMRLSDLNAQQVKERIAAYAEELQSHLDRESEGAIFRLDMGTTITAAYLIGHDAIICHVGDSRAYRLHEGELEQITEDQTMAQKLINMGYEEDTVADFHRILANYFGTGMTGPPHVAIYHIELQNEDRLLLCTDGLSKELTNDEIREHLTAGLEPQETCEAMLKDALDHGGRDNVTMILAEIDP